MTWKEFKDWAEGNGVRDDMEIWYIDFSWSAETVNLTQVDSVGLYIQ